MTATQTCEIGLKRLALETDRRGIDHGQHQGVLLDPRSGGDRDLLDHAGAFGAHRQTIDGPPTRHGAGIRSERFTERDLDRGEQFIDAVTGER